ncbi:MAG: class I SAM-dependent methyltransferase [Rhodobiaceae bacterium]|nr:class I SAM-dependent methyltransferase [Rhodobiaceae bacterium]
MTSDARFWDQTAEKYAASPIKDQVAYEHTLAETRKYLNSGDDLLEIGCGTGGTALLLADAVSHITATDISANMISIGAQKAAAQSVANVEFIQATPADTKLATKSYDAITGFNILHLLPDLEGDLLALRARLKPGGVLISKTPCISDWKWSALGRIAIPIMQFFGKAPYVCFLKGSDVEDKIEAAGFEIIVSENHNAFSRFIVAKKV